jgi:hypothetical protein
MSVRMGFHVAVVPSHAGSGSRPELVTLTCLEGLPGFRAAMQEPFPEGRWIPADRSGRVSGSTAASGLGELAYFAEFERLSRVLDRRVVELGTQHRFVHQVRIQVGQCLCRGCDGASIGYPVLC